MKVAYQSAMSLERFEREQALFQIQRLTLKMPFSLLASLHRENADFEGSVSSFWSAWTYLTSDKGEFIIPDLAPDVLKKLVEQAAIHRYTEDPTDAVDWIKSLPPKLKVLALKSSAMFLSETGEIESLEQLLDDYLVLSQDAGIMTSAALAIAERDGGRKAGDWLSDNAAMYTKAHSLGALLISIGATDPVEATELFDHFVQATSLGLSADVQLQLASWVAASDPVHALDWLAENPWGVMGGAGAQVAELWAESSLDEAKGYVQDLSSDVTTHRHEFLRNDYIEGLGKFYGKTDPEAGIKWASSLEGDLSEGVLKGIMEEWSKISPLDAGAYVASLQDEGLRKDLEKTFVRSLSMVDAASTAEWVDGVGISRVDPYAVNDLINTWSLTDPYAASEWMNQLPIGEQRDQGAKALSLEVAEIDPERAIAWALSISDGDQQARTLAQVVFRAYKDETEIQDTLTTLESSITDEQMDIIQSYVDKSELHKRLGFGLW